MPTLDEVLRRATIALAKAGIVDPQIDARILLCAGAGIDRATLLRDGDQPFPPAVAARFDDVIGRRLRREPVSRILGMREFWGIDLLLTPAVLDPRPDTETLVEAALRHVGAGKERPWRLLDLGTGSGALLCALLGELPKATGWGLDRSFEACQVARKNLEGCGFGDRSFIVQADWGGCCTPQVFDLVVSNPPYIETAVIPGLDAEVRDFDPVAALDGGPDGLVAYRALAAQLPGLLAPDGAAFLEVGTGQAEAVTRLLAAARLVPGAPFRDLAGIERVVTAARG